MARNNTSISCGDVAFEKENVALWRITEKDDLKKAENDINITMNVCTANENCNIQ